MTQGTHIHPTAIVEKGAELGQDVQVGPYAIIGPKVRIGDRTTLGSHVVVSGRTTIGTDNKIYSFASLGSDPQDLKFRGEDTELTIGNSNLIREYCNISLGTAGGGNKTMVGNQNLFMVFTHVAHDCIVGNHTIVANGVAIAGHVHIADGAVLGGLCAIHQFARIGTMAMIAGGAMVAQDVAPYCMVHGDRAKPTGLNLVGLRRAGLTSERMSALKDMYRLIFNENLTVEEACKRIEQDVLATPERETMLAFVRNSPRGLCR